MTGASDFEREQRGVALSMAAAFATTIIVLGLALVLDRAAPSVPYAARVQSALRIEGFVVIWLAAAIANVARLRFFSERDIAGSSAEPGSAVIRQAGAILQNTFEQVVLAIVAHMVVAATFDGSDLLIKALACLFAAGRLLFWAGYRHGARGRAFGFALTFYPSAVAVIASIAALLLGWAA